MTVAKLLTGRDMPLSNMEMALNYTYQQAHQRLQKHADKTKS